MGGGHYKWPSRAIFVALYLILIPTVSDVKSTAGLEDIEAVQHDRSTDMKSKTSAWWLQRMLVITYYH